MIVNRYISLLSSLESVRSQIPLFLTDEERTAVENTLNEIEYYTRLQIREVQNDYRRHAGL